MTKLSQITSSTLYEGKALTRLDFVMARYLALIASLPANNTPKPESHHPQDERPSLSKWVR